MTNGLYSSDLRGLCLKKLSTHQNLPYWFGKMRYTKIVFFLISSNFESTVSNPNLLEMKYEENNFSFHIIPKLWQFLKKSVLAKGHFIKHKPLISEECKVC